ncbi:MAG: hypothetical protein QNJ44_18740 [Rhodobacter sp.]|nr:hypothetical protein [Rhodobacter sp.]
MKTFAGCLAAVLIAAPGIASATYMCDKRFAETRGGTCPAGSHWDSTYYACVTNSS